MTVGSGAGGAPPTPSSIQAPSESGEVFVFPASFAQRRLWFLDRLGAGSAYTIAHAGSFDLRGPLDEAALARALAEIVRRHESLRTTFREIEGEPMQVVTADGTIELERFDLADQSPPDREGRLAELAAEVVERPFDLEAGPLFRARLVRLGEERHALLLSLHHAISDGWSIEVLLGELSALYAAFREGRESPLDELEVQVADVAVWEREMLQGERLRDLLGYWRERLEGALEVSLAADLDTPAAPSRRGRRVPLELPPELARRIAALGHQAGATPFMATLAAFFALLERQTGETDLVVGAPTANRPRREMEGLIGFFVNALPLRVDLSGDPNYRELLARVREACLGAYEHQALPFERLVEELKPQREIGRHPLFQTAFALQDVPQGGLELPGLDVEPLTFEAATVRFDLECHLWTRGERLAGYLLYARDRFVPATVERLARRYVRILEAVAVDPDLPLSRLSVVGEAERRTLLARGSGAVTDYPRRSTLHGLFERRAREKPDAEAVRDREGGLGYGALEARANQLAHRLRELGVRPGDRVGLCLRRSVEAVLVQLAVLKAGAAYLALDPEWPARRLAWTVEDADLALVVTRRGRAGGLAESGARRLDLDEERSRLEALPTIAPEVEVGPDDAAYVMYTSGSTGEPKGVVVPHRAVVRLLCDTDYLEVESEEVVLQVGPLTFDASTFEIWAALLHGARLVVLPAEELSLGRLGEAIRRHDVGTALITTALFHQMVDHELDSLGGLRQLITGGDVLSPDHARRALLGLGGLGLTNAYGPTEGAVIACCHRMADPSAVGASVPIGKPIANTRVYVLDEHHDLAPLGAVGELAIGGEGLALGYQGRPEATAERFVPDPFAPEPGQRLYLTGDLVRWRHDGQLEFRGRHDLQVKVHGVRVEPAEVESSLLSHPEVESAAVAARSDPERGDRLIGWVVARREGDEGSEESEERAGERVAGWRRLFDETYGDRAPEAAGSDFAGWNSSFTGEPIPVEEMVEWVEGAVARIAAFRPRRVLEIGCGTGLVLLRLAEECADYLGTDFSGAALDRLRAQLPALGEASQRVRLLRRPADDFEGIETGAWDAVVLNSVVQYFPDAAYLFRVLEGAVASAADGGVVFVGDVRDLALHRAFHTAVALERSAPETRLDEVVARAGERLTSEPELLVHPVLFARLADRISRVTHVEMRPKAGRFANELNAYRYDVVLHVGTSAVQPESDIVWRDGGGEAWSEEGLRRELEAAVEAETIGIRGVADRRLERDLLALERIDGSPGRHTVAELRGELEGFEPCGPSLERLQALAREHGRRLELAWSGPGESGRFDLLFERRAAEAAPESVALPGVVAGRRAPEPPGGLVNRPRVGRPAPDLGMRLRRFLADRLPAAMVPSAIVTVDEMPRNSSGKIDRGALPDPSPEALRDSAAAPPRDELEATLLDAWETVLGRPGIGIHDEFFELGGHSLLGVRLVAEVEKRTGRRVPLRALFDFSTVEGMAELLRQGDEPEESAAGSSSTALSESEHRDLLASMAASDLDSATPGSLLAGFHQGGSRPPLFWCFNVPSFEPSRLAERLDDEQPLYALLSGVGVLDWAERTAEALAGHYVDEIRAVQPEGPYRLGGNCGGARVALALARMLRDRGGEVERLCLLEHFEPELYRHPGPTLLLYGRESHLEIPQSFGWGEPGWERPFLSAPRVEWLPGAHGQFFDPENVGALATAIEGFLGSG